MKRSNIIVDGIKAGLITFLVMMGISLVVSLIINFSIYDVFSGVLTGTMDSDNAVTLSSVIKVTVLIFNLSLFNTIDGRKIGILLFGIIVFIAFAIVGNTKGRFSCVINPTQENRPFVLIVSLITSFTIAILQFVISFGTTGEIMEGLFIDFATVQNTISTIIITFMVQCIIMAYKRKNDIRNSGILAMMTTFKIMISLSFIVGTLGLFIGFRNALGDILLVIGTFLLVIPNVVAYVVLYSMGLPLDMSEPIFKLLEVFSISGYDNVLIKVIAIIIFITIIIYCVIKLNKENLLRDTMIYAVSVSMLTGLLTYCTTIDLQKVILLGEIRFGFNQWLAFVTPFLIICIISFIYYLILRLKDIIIIKDD